MTSSTKSKLQESAVETAGQALDAIGRKYHSRMRTVDAPSDSLSDGVVVPALREAIVEGVLPPGSRLSEVQIAKQLNVSRTPMREAFAHLEREGLVTVVARVGAFVRSMTLADNRALQVTHASLIGLVRRLRRIAMSRGGRMRVSCEQAVKIKNAIISGAPIVQDLMREQLYGACEAATDVLKENEGKFPVRGHVADTRCRHPAPDRPSR
jgi:DNA-binding GntR family transcriptional regulator